MMCFMYFTSLNLDAGTPVTFLMKYVRVFHPTGQLRCSNWFQTNLCVAKENSLKD